MAKYKKKKKQLKTWGFGLKNLDRELRRAEGYLVKKKWDAACQVLEPLTREYPNEKKVWQYLSDSSFSAGDMRLYQKACEGLFKVDSIAENAYQLGGAYLNNRHPLMALQMLRQGLELDENHQLAPEARKTITSLEPMLQAVLTEMGLSESDGIEIALLHEQGQVYMAQGDYSAAREAEEKVLQYNPEFLSARNNLSLLNWMETDADAAIAMAKTVLERESDNIHALSNLTRFWVTVGDNRMAKVYGERLKASHADAWDGWTKKVEGLSYLADDIGIVEVWQEFLAEEVEDASINGMFYHLCAVALARTGDFPSAIKQWKIALERDPSLKIAQENLNNIRKAKSEQHGAWPFSWEQWLMPKFSAEMQELIKSSMSSKFSGKLVSRFKEFLADRTEFLAMLPRILERGGPGGQEFVVSLAEQLKTSELLNQIKDFALQQNGTDQMRYHAANLAAQAKLIPKEPVKLWMAGEWRELMLISYQFHNESLFNHSKAVETLLAEVVLLLRSDRKESALQAETLLKKALVLEPESPDLMNNLAVALSQQGLEEESKRLIYDLVKHYPDYIFASASLAKLLLESGDLLAAEELLKPFLSRERFHFLEFSVLMSGYIEILWAKKQKGAALSWLDMWENVTSQFEVNDPKIQYWRKRLKSNG